LIREQNFLEGHRMKGNMDLQEHQAANKECMSREHKE
jgi:hypothetical protein